MQNSGLRLRSITFKDGFARPMQMSDGLQNVLSGLGVSPLDQMRGAGYFAMEIPKDQIDASVRTSALSKKVHTIPATDSIRAGWTFKADTKDVNKIEGEQRRLGLAQKLRKALVMARMYGGSAIMMGVGNDDTATPLDVSRVKAGGLRYLHVLSRWQLSAANLILDPASPYYGMPDQYLVNAGNGNLVAVHPSRMVKFTNGDTSDELMLTQSGWSDPLLMSLWTTLVNSDTAQGSFAALLNKAKVDTITIAGLGEILATAEGEAALKKRILATQAFEGLFGIKLLGGPTTREGNGDTWQTFTQSWSNVPEVMDAFLQSVASAADIPFTRLSGRSPGGLASTGESDLEDYHQTISAAQELDIRPRMEQIFDVLYRSALGAVPADGLWFTFSPLRIDSEETRANNAKTMAEATTIWSDSGIVPNEVAERMAKSLIVESGMWPGAETAYQEYAEGLLEPLVEEDEPEADDPLIPVDETGAPRLNRESRLFAANDAMARLLSGGVSMADARRLVDAQPRPVYVSRRLLNASDIRKHFEKQGLPVTVADAKLHTTVIYSKAPVDWIAAGGGSWGTAELTVSAGGPRMMDRFGPKADAIVLMFAAPELSWRHRELLESGCSHDFPYHAHVTLNYGGWDGDLATIEPYKGELRFGFEDWKVIQENWSSES